jgi:hypothetical protein
MQAEGLSANTFAFIVLTVEQLEFLTVGISNLTSGRSVAGTTVLRAERSRA